MARGSQKGTASVGVADHCGWAVLVTVAGDGGVLDRRRVELVDEGLPKLPHHHDCQRLPIDEAVALVERVRRSARACASACLDALASAVPMSITAIAIRACPPLPATVAERITNYRAQNVADTVMYRDEVARAASARGWTVHWYDVRRVSAEAQRALGRGSIDAVVEKAGAALGPPWQKDHRVAMMAAIAAGTRPARSMGEARRSPAARGSR